MQEEGPKNVSGIIFEEREEEEDYFDYEYSSSPKGLVDTLVM